MSDFTIMASGVTNVYARRALICVAFPVLAWAAICCNGAGLVGIVAIKLYRGFELDKLVADVRRVW